METTATIQGLSRGMGGELLVTLALTPNHIDELKKLEHENLEVKIGKHRERRSLSSNSYAWVLITKIAQCMRPPLNKEEVYIEMLKRYGQGGIVTVQKNEQYDSVLRAFDYYEHKGDGTANGKEFAHMMVYIGSSQYSSSEMSIFISGIVEEARDLGIETLTPDELKKMAEGWGK
jgi:hypothetical protein